MRFHLLAIPNAQTTREYSLCGFTQATIRFAKLLKLLGHTVLLYGSEENEAPCDELVTVISKKEQGYLLGTVAYQYATLGNSRLLWEKTNPRIIEQIAKRKQPKDFICTIGGLSQIEITAAHPDCMAVEYSIGYVGSYAPFRVFESNIWRHCTHGFQDAWDGRFFDTVIPLFFDAAEFEYRGVKEDFALFVGRLTPKKGISIACQAAAAAGIPLKVIGHGDTSLVTHGAEYLGALSAADRNHYLSRARVLLCPTQYVEPFGSVAVEAQMCGTPVVSTDFGGFIETVEQDRTGFRCNYLGEFVRGIQQSGALCHSYIRQRAVEKYSIEAVAPLYQRYFERLNLLWGSGWNSLD
jgi:glycosyltransferase involved in cell wall biosynthesis